MIKKPRHRLLDHKRTEVLLLTIIALVVVSGWFNSGLPKGHDALSVILSAEAAAESIFDYHTIPEWSGQQFLGYPLFYVYPPLGNLLVLILSIPFGWELGVKILFILCLILSGVFSYYYIYELTNNRFASFISGLSYMFMPFFLLEVFFEGHLGSAIPYMLIPLVFLTTERTLREPKLGRILLAGIFIALLILNNPKIFAILVGPFIALYGIFHVFILSRQVHKTRVTAIAFLGIFLIGLMLTSFWWFPLLWEVDYFHNTSSALSDDGSFNTTLFLQALHLRPHTCCAPASAYGESESFPTIVLQWIPVVLASLGILLNHKNKYAWFFAAIAVITIILAMGTHSPLNLYSIIHRYYPILSGLSNPMKFIFLTSFAYSVLAGFAIKGIVDHRKYFTPSFKLSIMATIILSLLVMANTWQESRTSFQTFNLTQDQQEALDWLSDQPDGRIMPVPMNTWVYSTETRNIINPICYSWLHGMDTVNGGIPHLAPRWSADYVESVYWMAKRHEMDISDILDILGVNYVVVDKTDPTATNHVLDDSLMTVWESDTIDIYENQDPYPRVFDTTSTAEETIALSKWTWGQGSQFPANIKPSYEYGQEYCYSWKSDYVFERKGENLLNIDTNFQIHEGANLVSFWYYLPQALPDITMTTTLWEDDGTGYTHILDNVMTEGWHKAHMALERFQLEPGTQDENSKLDKGQIVRMSIGVREFKQDDNSHEFSIYFSHFHTATEWQSEPQIWEWAQGTQYPAQVVLSQESSDLQTTVWKSDYAFGRTGRNWLNLSMDLESHPNATTLFISYYLPNSLPDITMSLVLWEEDGSAYSHALDTYSSGWYIEEIPLDAFQLHWSTEDENAQLDQDELFKIWACVDKTKQDDKQNGFSIHLGQASTTVLYESDISQWAWSYGTQYPAQITISEDHVRTKDYCWRSDYKFNQDGHNWLNISTEISVPSDASQLTLWYYLPESLPEVNLTTMLWESDDSAYYYDPAADTSSGWHKIELPLSLFLPYWSSHDENDQLDYEQISKLWLCVSEDKKDDTPHEFSIYFPRQLTTYNIQLEETLFYSPHPGKYQVYLNHTGPSRLILSESYYPGWIAKIDGETIPSEPAYGFLNGWDIDKTGQFEVTLEFVPSAQRRWGRIISVLTAVGIAVALMGLWIRKRQRSRNGIDKNNSNITNIQREGEY
ncbi:MAG: 6-pyruvoyl-tetrahydropterin synthase-related protein [Chloroflexota bacterium]|nr:6-pyruvoyl-tetrahydropterin synthase-related protein [Chloroflexota bacterium]